MCLEPIGDTPLPELMMSYESIIDRHIKCLIKIPIATVAMDYAWLPWTTRGCIGNQILIISNFLGVWYQLNIISYHVTVFHPTPVFYMTYASPVVDLQSQGSLWNVMSLDVNSLGPRKSGHHFADDILKCILLNKNAWISIEISLKFVPEGPINNISALVQIMAWHHPVGYLNQ